MAPGGPEGSAQADLGASFEDRDDHDVGHPHRSYKERDGAEAQEETVECALGVGLGDESRRRLGDVHLAGVLRIGGGAEQAVDRVDVAGLGAHVDGGGVSVEAEIALGGREPDQDRGVDGRGEHGGFQDAGYVEPHVVDPDALAGEDPVDARVVGRPPPRGRRRALGRWRR